MADKNVITSAYEYLSSVFNLKAKSRRGSMDKEIKNSTNGITTPQRSPPKETKPVLNGSQRSHCQDYPSPFTWNETSVTSALVMTDLQDALPSPRVLPPAAPVPKTTAPKGFFANRYHMNHEKRGIALIINNKQFLPELGMPERKGTDLDAEALTKALKVLQFDVKQYDNLSTCDMEEAMKYFASLDYKDSDCFFAAILSHGDDGVVYGKDGKISVDRLVAPFKGNKSLSLAGKPKIFIIQACRGDRFDRGVDIVETDGTGTAHRFPAEADFLFAYSTIPGFYSWRNTDNGSWFIQALSKLIILHYGPDGETTDPRRESELDFVRLLTRVHFEVAYFYKSNVPNNPDLDQQKQVPSMVSTLTRDLYFPPSSKSGCEHDPTVIDEVNSGG